MAAALLFCASPTLVRWRVDRPGNPDRLTHMSQLGHQCITHGSTAEMILEMSEVGSTIWYRIAHPLSKGAASKGMEPLGLGMAGGYGGWKAVPSRSNRARGVVSRVAWREDSPACGWGRVAGKRPGDTVGQRPVFLGHGDAHGNGDNIF